MCVGFWPDQARGAAGVGLRRGTVWVLPDQAELEQKVQRERALAEAEGRAREARENEDVNRRTLTLRLEEERKKLVEAINTTFGCARAAK